MVTPLDEIRRSTGGLSLYKPPAQVQRALNPQPPRRRAPVAAPGKSPISNVLAGAATDRRKKEDEPQELFGLSQLGDLAMGALNVVDFGRRAAVLGVEEFATEFLGTDINDDDERSNWNKLTDISYGVHDLIDEDSMPSWMRSTLGFAGDVLLDPLTYVTAGVGGVAGKAGRAGYAAKVRGIGVETAERLAKEGVEISAIRAAQEPFEQMARKVGRYGPGIIDDADVLQKIGLQKQGLRFGRPFSPGKGSRIGGDTIVGDKLGEVARKSNQFFAKGRAKFYDTGVGGRLQDWRSPEAIKRAQQVLRAGESDGGMDVPVAASLIQFHDAARGARNTFSGLYAPKYEKLAKTLNRMDDGAAVEAAESAAGRTDWNDFFDELAAAAKKQGVSFDTRKNYVPHILTPEASKVLREARNDDIRKATGVLITHLDDPSGVTEARRLTGGKKMIDGQEVDFGNGTIAEVNAALAPITGVEKFFDDNMTSIAAKYIDRLSSDVGTMQGLGRVAKMFPDMVRSSDDAARYSDLFYELIDGDASKLANEEALKTLRAQASNIDRLTKNTQTKINKNVEEARRIVKSAADNDLSHLRTIRKSTINRIKNLEDLHSDALKRRQGIITAFDDELDHMDTTIDSLRQELDATQRQVRKFVEEEKNFATGATPEARAANNQHIVETFKKQNDLIAAIKEVEADQKLLTEINLDLQTMRTKRRIITNRRGSTAPIPHPDTGAPQRTTVGRSFETLGSDFRPQVKSNRHVGITPEEEAWRAAVEGGADSYRIDRLGAEAERARTAAINRTPIENEGLRRVDDFTGKMVDETGDPHQREKLFAREAQRINKQFDSDINLARSDAESAAGAERTPLEDVEDLTQTGVLSPAEKGQLTKARKRYSEAEAEVREWMATPEGRQWLVEMSELDKGMEVLFGDSFSKAWRNVEPGKVLWRGDPQNPVARETGYLFDELRAAKTDLEQATKRPAPTNPRAQQQQRLAALDERKNTVQKQIAEVNREIKRYRDRDPFGPSQYVNPSEWIVKGKQAKLSPRPLDERMPDDMVARNVAGEGAETREAHIKALKDKRKNLRKEVADIERRRDDALNVKPPTAKRPAPKRKAAEVAAAKERIATAEATIEEYRKRTAAGTRKFKSLQGKANKAAATIDANKETALKRIRARTKSNMPKGRDMDQVSVMERQRETALERLVKKYRRGPEYRQKMGEQATSTPEVFGRLRADRTQAEIQDELDDIIQASLPRQVPDDAKKLLDSKALPYRTDTGANRNVYTTARTVLSAGNDASDYLDGMVRVGALTEDEAYAHLALIDDLTEALDADTSTFMSTDKLAEEGASTRLSNIGKRQQRDQIERATEMLQRANRFVARYAQVVEAGAEPSDWTAKKILRQILDRETKNLDNFIAKVKKNPNIGVDEEIEDIVDVMLDATAEWNVAEGVYSGVKQHFRSKTLDPIEDLAGKETNLRYLENTALPEREEYIRLNEEAATKALEADDGHAYKNAQRNLKKHYEKRRFERERVRILKEEIAELQGGVDNLDVEDFKFLLGELDAGPMSGAQREVLSKFLDDDTILSLRLLSVEDPETLLFVKQHLSNQLTGARGVSRIEEAGDLADAVWDLDLDELTPDQLVRLQEFFGSDEFDIQRLAADFPEELGSVEDYLKARLKPIQPEQTSSQVSEIKDASRIGNERKAGQFRQDTTENQVYRLLGDQLNIQNSIRLSDSKRQFEEMFDAMGLKRDSGMSRAKTLDLGMGFSNNIEVSEKMLRRKAKEIVKKRRNGTKSKDFVLRDLEARRARLNIINRGLGKTTQKKSRVTVDPNSISWREVVFGDVLGPRPAAARTLPRASKTAQTSLEGVPRPSNNLAKNSPAVQRTMLERELRGPAAFNEKLDRIIKETSPKKQKKLEKKGRKVEKRLPKKEDKAYELIADTARMEQAGSPQRQAAIAGIDESTERANLVGEELNEMLRKKQAKRVEREAAIAEANPEVAQTSAALREVNEQLYGPGTTLDDAIPMGTRSSPPEQQSLPMDVTDPNQKALPAAGETSGPKAMPEGLNAKFEQAKGLAEAARQKNIKAGYKNGGMASVNDELIRVMDGIDMPLEQRAQVEALLATAVEQESNLAEFQQLARDAEKFMKQAKAGTLEQRVKLMTKAQWEPMAEALTRGLDEDTKYMMHTQMARHFTRLNDALSTGRFWKAVEQYTNFFKTYATMRPDFHVRNAISAMFMNSTDGVPVRYNFTAMKQWKQFRDGGDEYLTKLRKNPTGASGVHGLSNDELADAFEVALGSGAGGQYAERGLGPTMNAGSRVYNNPATRLSRKAGEYVEGPVRLAVALDAFANQGMDKYDALLRVNRLHFDYSDVSQMDQYAKRFIPFWTFMSRNIPLQLTQAMGKPRWYAGYRSLKRNFEGEPDPFAPEYWQTGGNFAAAGRVPGVSELLGSDDNQLWFTPDLAHNQVFRDMETLANFIGNSDQKGAALTSFNPLFTTPVEYFTGTDLFTGQSFQEDDLVKLGGLQRVLQPFLNVANRAEGRVADENTVRSLRSLVPTWEQADRLIPTIVNGEFANEAREAEQRTKAIQYLGLPFQQLTPERKEQVAKGQYYDKKDELAKREAMIRLLNS